MEVKTDKHPLRARDFESVRWAKRATDKRLAFFWRMVEATEKRAELARKGAE
jgi:hypothetical protein